MKPQRIRLQVVWWLWNAPVQRFRGMIEVPNCSLFVVGRRFKHKKALPLENGLLKTCYKKMSEAQGASLGKLEFFYVNCLRAFRSLFGIKADLVALGK